MIVCGVLSVALLLALVAAYRLQRVGTWLAVGVVLVVVVPLWVAAVMVGSVVR